MTSQQTPETSAASASTRPARGRSNRVLWIAGPLVLALVGGWFYLNSGRYASTDNAYVKADQVTISAQVAGRVVEVAVRENQAVHTGDLLFRIDPEPLQIAVEQMEAQIAAAADYLNASRDTFRSASADLRSTEATLRTQESQLKRMREMRARGLIAQKALDDAINDVATARGERDSNAANVAKAQTMLGGAVDTPLESMATYRIAKAQLAKVRLDLAHAEVRAPIDGVIGKMHLQAGDYLKATDVFDLDAIGLIRMAAALNRGADLSAKSVDQAHVSSISPAAGSEFSILPAQNATGNWVKIVQRIPVRLLIDPDTVHGLVLRAGMSATIRIDTGRENSLMGRLLAPAGNASQAALVH